MTTNFFHFSRLTVFLVIQNIFHKSKYLRTISLNSNYLCVFKSCRDKSFITHLARQILPEASSEIVRIFNDATSKNFSHILFDLRQNCPQVLRYRTFIENEDFSTCYCPDDFPSCEKHEKINQQQTYFACVEKL